MENKGRRINMEAVVNRKQQSLFREFVFLLLVSAYCMNFLSVGVYFPLLLMPILFVYFIKNKISGTSMLLIAFSVTYSISVYVYNFVELRGVLLYLTFPLACYLTGSALVKGDAIYKKTYRLLLVIIGSFTLFGYLSVSKTLSLYGHIETGGRLVVSYWGNNAITATGLNTYLSLGLSLFFVCFLPKDSAPKLFRLFCFVCAALSTYCALTLGNRTGAVIIIASALTVFLFAGQISPKKVIFFLSLLLIAVLVRLFYEVDFLGFKTAFEGTLMYSRFNEMGIEEDPRYEAWKAAFWGLFDNPLGGKKTHLPLSYAHNLWLDVGYSTGIFPFLLLIMLTVVSVKSLKNLIISKAPTLLKGLFIALYTAFFITFFVEPIMEGWFTYFTVFCLILGTVQQVNRNLSTAI